MVKRVDVVASLLRQNGKLEDLLDAEFAYAPPLCSGGRPSIFDSCTARNELLEGIESLPPDADLDGRFIVDVRRAREASDRPLPEKETKNMPFEEFRVNCDQVPKDRDVVCICSKGVRSSEAARILKDKGCADVKYVGGGTLMKLAQKAK